MDEQEAKYQVRIALEHDHFERRDDTPMSINAVKKHRPVFLALSTGIRLYSLTRNPQVRRSSSRP